MAMYERASDVHTDQDATIYLHFPCFDGLVSATIAMVFLESVFGWHFRSYRRVNYDGKERWHRRRLPERSAVVDFLYHPQATFWADHHPTTFQSDRDALQFQLDRNSAERVLIYDQRATSCALLLMNSLRSECRELAQFDEMAEWADKIDSAKYDSVHDAVFGASSATDINLALTVDADNQSFCELLLDALRSMTLKQVSELAEVHRRTTIARNRTRQGLKAVERSIALNDANIATFSVAETAKSVVSRYSPYIFFPDASYSIGLVRSGNSCKITAMRNPWRQFQSIELGQIFRKYGGGGHQRVASLIIKPDGPQDPDKLVEEIASDMREQLMNPVAV